MTPSDIRARRTALGLTQGALAERLGVRQATISEWESGRRVPLSAFMLQAALEKLAAEQVKRVEGKE